MQAPPLDHIPELLEIHHEELAFLWAQRRAAQDSPLRSLRELGELNERIEAHAQGFLAVAADVARAALEPRLDTDERDEAFAAAYPLLRLGVPEATRVVLAVCTRVRGPKLDGLRDALSLAPPHLYAADMRDRLAHAEPSLAAHAAVVLANLRLLDPGSPRLAELLEHDDVALARLAWLAVAAADFLAPRPGPKRPYRHALGHGDPGLRSAGWAAVAWTGQVRALPLLRQFADAGDAVSLRWLAVLGAPSDAALVLRHAAAGGEHASRCRLVDRLGHPDGLQLLMQWMEGDDPRLASEAGVSFTAITGESVRGVRAAPPVGDDADAFTRAMVPDIWMPDLARAQAALQRHGPRWAQGTRWRCGLRLDVELGRGHAHRLDLEAWWDASARAALAGGRLSAPAPI